MKSKKKIFFLTLDITLVGGVERMLSTLVPFFVEMNDFEVEIVSVFNSRNINKFDFKNINIKFLSDEKFNRNTKLLSLRTYFFLFKKIIFYKISKNAIYISTFPNISILLLIFKRSKNIIISEHAQFNAHSTLFNKLRKIVYKNAEKITLLTKEQYSIFEKFCQPHSLSIIPNPINSVSIKLQTRKYTIITVGRLVPEKGFHMLIKVLSNLKKNIPNFNAIIIGSGPEKNMLLNLINKLELNDNIQIIENETNVYKYLNFSSIFVVTSLTESFGLAMLEALSIGIPVVAFDAGDGPKNLIVNNFNGFLVKFGDLTNLKLKILEILEMNDNEWKQYSNNAIFSSQPYQVQNIYSRWKSLINQ